MGGGEFGSGRMSCCFRFSLALASNHASYTFFSINSFKGLLLRRTNLRGRKGKVIILPLKKLIEEKCPN